MAKAILKMPYRRRQEDQPSVEYPSDMEEDKLELGNNNPTLPGKLNYQNGINLGGDLEIEDELKEIDNEMFAIPNNRSQKSSRNVLNQGFTTDFTTSVLGMNSYQLLLYSYGQTILFLHTSFIEYNKLFSYTQMAQD